jgi:hypothetical protein
MDPIADNPPGRFLPWPVIAARRPDLGAFGALVLERSKVVYLATVSRVGRPRVTPLPVSLDDGLLIRVDSEAPAARELRSNPFFHLQAGSSAEEQLTIRGWARIVSDGHETVFELFADAAEGGPTPCPS